MKVKHLLDQEKKAIRQQITRVDIAWDQRDGQTFAQLFQEDGDFQFHTGLMLRGRREIETHYAKTIFPAMNEDHRHRATVFNIRFIRDGVAIVDTKVEIYIQSLPNGPKRVIRTLQGTAILVKQEDRWLFSAVRLIHPQQG